MASDVDWAVEAFDQAAVRGDAATAVGLTEDLLDQGVDPIDVLVDVIACVQRRVGLRWLNNEWSVPQEHAATAAAMAALEAVNRRVRRRPSHRGRVVMACAEREWHAAPAMIIACAMQAHGWDVTLLGASTPTARLDRYLRNTGPDVTAVSCSVLGALPASRRFIETSTSEGIPVVVGGAAFGPDGTRARTLGATAWAGDARSMLTQMDALRTVVSPTVDLPEAVTVECSGLQLTRPRLIAAAAADWAAGHRGTGDDELGQYALDAATHVVDAVVASVLTGDDTIVAQAAGWLTEMCTARGGDVDLVANLGRSLTHQLRDFPLAHQVMVRHWTTSSQATA